MQKVKKYFHFLFINNPKDYNQFLFTFNFLKNLLFICNCFKFMGSNSIIRLILKDICFIPIYLLNLLLFNHFSSTLVNPRYYLNFLIIQI